MAGRPIQRAEQARLSQMNPDQLRESIYDRIERGDSLTQIAWDMNMRRRFLCDWLEKPEQFPDYARSRMRAATALAENTIAIADDVEPSAGEVMKAKLRINARHFLARAWDRNTFGEGQQQHVVNLAVLHADVIRKRSAELEMPQTPEKPQTPAAALTAATTEIRSGAGTSGAATIDAVPVPDKPASSVVTNTEQTR